jgi:hypothetical protein
MAANPIKIYADKLVAQAKADPKKASILGVLVVIMIFSWYRMAGGSGSGGDSSVGIGPARASASFTPVGPGGSVLPNNLHVSSSGTSATVAALLEWQRRPIAPLSRNLFVINYDFFPQDGSAPAPVHVQQGDGFWDHIAKSMTARADQKREREVLVENLRAQALQLKLQSTVLGASPKALVNGQLVRVGDVVASFRVTKIEARRIVVEREGIKLEVRSN